MGRQSVNFFYKFCFQLKIFYHPIMCCHSASLWLISLPPSDYSNQAQHSIGCDWGLFHSFEALQLNLWTPRQSVPYMCDKWDTFVSFLIFGKQFICKKAISYHLHWTLLANQQHHASLVPYKLFWKSLVIKTAPYFDRQHARAMPEKVKTSRWYNECKNN